MICPGRTICTSWYGSSTHKLTKKLIIHLFSVKLYILWYSFRMQIKCESKILSTWIKTRETCNTFFNEEGI